MADYKKGDTASWDAEEVRRGQASPRRSRKRRRRRMNPFVYILMVLVLSALLAGVGWLLMSDLCAFNRGAITTSTVEVTAEDSVGDVAEKLQDAGLIKYKWFFRLFAGVAKAEEKIGLGTYELNTDMDYRALIMGMRSNSGNMTADTVQVTIPEGYTVAQTIALLAKNGVNTEEKLLDAAKNEDFGYEYISKTTGDLSRLEGFLFPDTYEFYVGHNPKGALEKLIDNFDRKMNEDRTAVVEASGYSLQQIITIASLIEKETDGTDQGKIASVIYNRLTGPGDKAGTYGMLQIDASLLYALPGHEGAITSADLATDSKYNLSKYAGLPPTPIANPGSASIDAALNPESTNYYYYALGKDLKHRFFTNYKDHTNFVNSGEYIGN